MTVVVHTHFWTANEMVDGANRSRIEDRVYGQIKCRQRTKNN